MKTDLWRFVTQLSQGDEIEVVYDSKRSDEEQTMTGKAVEVNATGDSCKVGLVRDDGQKVVLKSDGKLMSLGSNFPHTGWANTVRKKEFETLY